MIARGCVRVFSQVINEVNGKRSMEYEEDLFPGEIFGEAALGGVHHRYITVQAITDVDLILVEDEDYMAIQDRGVSKMSVDERFRYIQEVPVFKNWEPYRLYRVAHALQQDELEKGVVAMRKGEPNKDWKFVVGGKLDIVSSLKDPSVITSVQVHDYFGESGLLNKAEKDKFAPQIVESCYAVAATKVEILTLTEANFNQIITYRGCIDSIRSAFMAKKAWRQSRSIQLKHEKNRVKDLKSKLMHTANEDSEAARALGITISSPTCTSPMTATVTRTATKTATGTGSRAATRTDGHISPVNTCTFTDTLTHTGTSSAEHIRPVSPGGLVAKVTSTFTPNDNEVNAFVKVTEHLTTNEYGLIDVDDIPEAMDVPYDPLVMTGTCRNERERLKMASRITDRFRPASASGMKKSMTNRGSTVRPSSAGVTSARPKSANATATQHASKPKFSDDTMDPKPALQRPSTAGAIRSGTSTGKLNSLLPPRSANVISRPISGVDPRFQRDDKERTAAMGAGIGNKMENIQVSRSTPFLYTNKNYNNEGLKVTNPVTRDAKLHPNAKYMHLPVVTVATYNTAPFRNDSTNNPAVRTQTGFVGYGRPNSPKLVGTASIPNQQTFGDFKRTHNM